MKNKSKYLVISILTLTVLASGGVLMGSNVGATTSVTAQADGVVNVNTACVFDSDYDYEKAFSASIGTSVDTEDDTSKPTVHVTCNNINGFSVKAVGFSPDATHASGNDGNTAMYSTVGTIPTGTSGTGSWWAMKVTSAAVSTGSAASTVTVPAAYDNTYGVIPSTATPVATFAGSTAGPVKGELRTDYKISLSASQAAGTYTGKVKYTVVGN